MHRNTINYGKIIKDLRKKFKLTQSELGERISVGKTAVSNYETGYSIPSAHILEDIAAVFNMNLLEFLAQDEGAASSLHMPRVPQPINDIIIPYIKEANINESILTSGSYMNSHLTMPQFMLNDNDSYICIKMPDDSMAGDNINKNDYLIIKKDSMIKESKIVLAIHKPTNMYMIRRCIRENHIIALIPSSSSAKYSIIRADERDNDVCIIGYVEKTINSVK